MNTIETIRAEVERRKKEVVDASFPPVIKKTRISELSIVLDILDDIQERTDNPITFTLQEQPVKIDIRKELASIEFMGVNDARDTETIARHFYALGQQSKEQPVCEGEEEEIQKYMSERWEFGCINPTTPVYLYDFTTDELKECARHFAKWGAEHLKKL